MADILGIVLTVFGTILAWHIHEQTRKAPNLSAHVQESFRAASVGEYAGDLVLTFRGVEVGCIFFIQMILMNDGDLPIDLSAVDEPVLLEVPAGASVLNAVAIGTSRKSLKLALHRVPRGLVIEVPDFRQGDFLVVEALLAEVSGIEELQLICNEPSYRMTIPLIDFPFGDPEAANPHLRRAQGPHQGRLPRERDRPTSPAPGEAYFAMPQSSAIRDSASLRPAAKPVSNLGRRVVLTLGCVALGYMVSAIPMWLWGLVHSLLPKGEIFPALVRGTSGAGAVALALLAAGAVGFLSFHILKFMTLVVFDLLQFRERRFQRARRQIARQVTRRWVGGYITEHTV